MEAKTFSKPSFLSKWDEWFLFAVPSVGLLVGALYWFSDPFGQRLNWHDNLLYWFLCFVFLDSVHVIYTFVLLWALPELRQWTRSVFSGFWIKTALVALGVGVTFYLLEFSSLTEKFVWLATFYAFLDTLGPQQHTLAQMRGISFCYNSAIRRANSLDSSELIRAAHAERREKILFRGLLIGDLMFSTGFFLRSGNYEVPVSVLWFGFVGAGIVAVTSAGILLNARLYPRQEGSGKLPYLSRILLFTLKNVAVPAAFFVRATHGSEYLVIVKQMVKNSKVSEARKKRIFALFFGVTLIYFLPLFLGPERQRLQTLLPLKEPSMFFPAAVMFHIVVRWVHYYLDAMLYRMKDPATRAIVAPLLVHAPEAEESRSKIAA